MPSANPIGRRIQTDTSQAIEVLSYFTLPMVCRCAGMSIDTLSVSLFFADSTGESLSKIVAPIRRLMKQRSTPLIRPFPNVAATVVAPISNYGVSDFHQEDGMSFLHSPVASSESTEGGVVLKCPFSL